MKGLTIEQMEFLASKGLDAADMIAFAKMGNAKSKGAERTARWRARKRSGVTDSVTSDVTRDASPPPIDNIHTPPVSSDDETTPARKNGRIAKPAEVSEQTWTDFLAVRKAKRAPMTETALAATRREAAKAGWTLEAALAQCASRGWQNFSAEWVDKPQPRGPPASGNDFLDHVIQRKQLQESRP